MRTGRHSQTLADTRRQCQTFVDIRRHWQTLATSGREHPGSIPRAFPEHPGEPSWEPPQSIPGTPPEQARKTPGDHFGLISDCKMGRWPDPLPIKLPNAMASVGSAKKGPTDKWLPERTTSSPSDFQCKDYPTAEDAVWEFMCKKGSQTV